MKSIGIVMTGFIMLTVGSLIAAAAPPSFDNAKWIWSPLSDPAGNPGDYLAGSVYFRATLDLPPQARAVSAEAIITCDNLYILHINGKPVGESAANNASWNNPGYFDIARLLTPGRNVVAVQGVNTLPGAAGLIAKITVQLSDGKRVELATSDGWKCNELAPAGWQAAGFDDRTWTPAHVIGDYGVGPWSRVAPRGAAVATGAVPGAVARMAEAVRLGGTAGLVALPGAGAGMPCKLESKAPADTAWPEGLIYLGDDCSLYRPLRATGTSLDTLGVTIFNTRKSRAFPEHDLPAPMKLGRKLYALTPVRPGVTPRLLLDAGKGAIGSPSVSFDGQWIYVSMAFEDEPFFHIYRLPAAGGKAERLTEGPFHDIDPAEMPDGRIIFTSTRIGTFEEYHNPPARALFAMRPDGRGITPITNTIVFDNEPEILADGRILFIRSDNFFDRGKVETMLHAVHPDGTEGYTEFALDMGPDYGGRLRAFYCGSPAPMADGRVAFVSAPGITIGTPGQNASQWKHLRFDAGDVAALPDGRLLCTVARQATVTLPAVKAAQPSATATSFSAEQQALIARSRGETTATTARKSAATATAGSPKARAAKGKKAVAATPKRVAAAAPKKAAAPAKAQPPAVTDYSYETIGVVDPDGKDGKIIPLFDSHGAALHSVAYLGARQRPPVLAPRMDLSKADDPQATGILFCQDARFTRNTTAGWPHVRAIRVLSGKGLNLRSSHSYIVHAGSEVVELGTVPLAPDGSFAVEVPADTPIAFQAVDAEGRSELNEMSWIYVRPGEQRGCVGCHQTRQNTPVRPLNIDALRTPPLKLVGQGRPHRFRGNNAAVTGLMELQFDRYREVASLNRHSETANPLATGQDEVRELIGQLRGRDEGLRISAAYRLAIFRAAAAAPALAEALTRGSREARVAAAVALASCGTRESVQPLLEALGSEDPQVAQAAALALENLTAHAEPFNPYAAGEARQSAAGAWGRWFQTHSWADIERELAARLESKDRDIVRRAAVALGHTGGEAARAALRRYVTAARELNPYPDWKLAHRSDGTRFNSLDPVNPRTLQAATRALGYLQDEAAIPLLAETIARNSDPDKSNLFLTEACIEALGRIGTPAAENALIEAQKGLKDYYFYVGWYGDHPALFACHSSPPHYFIAEALDWIGSRRAGDILPNLIRSLPTDPDRALFPYNDDAEALVGRVIRRCGMEDAVTQTCLSILGEPGAARNKEIETAIGTTYRAWAGLPDPENRAAHVLSLACRDTRYEPRVRAAFDRYRALPRPALKRVADKALPDVIPVKNWASFFLARTLGNLADSGSVGSLVAALDPALAEASSGYPDPLSPGCLFLHNELTPCWRAAAAWALGSIGDTRAVAALLQTVGNLKNAPDTRHTAAVALQAIHDPASVRPMREMAADYPDVSTRRALLRACQAISERDAATRR